MIPEKYNLKQHITHYDGRIVATNRAEKGSDADKISHPRLDRQKRRRQTIVLSPSHLFQSISNKYYASIHSISHIRTQSTKNSQSGRQTPHLPLFPPLTPPQQPLQLTTPQNGFQDDHLRQTHHRTLAHPPRIQPHNPLHNLLHPLNRNTRPKNPPPRPPLPHLRVPRLLPHPAAPPVCATGPPRAKRAPQPSALRKRSAFVYHRCAYGEDGAAARVGRCG